MGTEPAPGSERAGAALVLGGGGAHAAYQVGVLRAILERQPGLEFPILTGVSAGAINIAYLAAYPGPLAQAVEALRREWGHLTVERVYRIRPARLAWAGLRWLGATTFGHRGGPTLVRGLMDMEPLREFLAGRVDFRTIDAKVAAGRLRAVALSATPYASEQTVTFVEGAEDVPTWRRALRYSEKTRLTLDHVMASAAIPILFPAVQIGDLFYGDGSVRQTAPLAPAIHLGARALLVITTHSDLLDPGPAMAKSAPEYPSVAEVMGVLLHAVFLDGADVDAERLERINRLLESCPTDPSGPSGPDGLEPVRLLMLRPSKDLGALAVAQRTRLPTVPHWLVRGMGGHRAAAADFLSYLLFDPGYTTTLIDLGYADAQHQWPRIERFLADAYGPSHAGH
jgi:NTE family protein